MSLLDIVIAYLCHLHHHGPWEEEAAPVLTQWILKNLIRASGNGQSQAMHFAKLLLGSWQRTVKHLHNSLRIPTPAGQLSQIELLPAKKSMTQISKI